MRSERPRKSRAWRDPAWITRITRDPLRQIYLAEAGRDPNTRTMRDRPTREVDQHRKQAEDPGSRNTSAESNVRRAHCKSRKHGDLRCWKKMDCNRCGKKGYSSDRNLCGGVSSLNCVLRPQNTHFSRLPTYGRGPRFREWTLTHLVYPLAGGLHYSVDSDGEESVYYFGEVDLGPQVDMLHWVGR